MKVIQLLTSMTFQSKDFYEEFEAWFYHSENKYQEEEKIVLGKINSLKDQLKF